MPGTKKKILDWSFTPLFWLTFGITLAFFDLMYRIEALVCKGRGYQSVLKGMNHSILACLRFAAGVHYQVIGNFEGSNLPVIVISNHQSMFDIPFLTVALKSLKLRFVAKEQLAHSIPAVSVALRNGEHALIDRKDSDQAIPEIQRAAQLAKDKGLTLAVFPEGTRSREGRLRDFKVGGIVGIIETLGEALILPVAIKGSWLIASKSLLPLSYGHSVEVHIGEPFAVKVGENLPSAVEKAKEQIHRALNPSRT